MTPFTFRWLAAILALSAIVGPAYAQTPACAAPGCNSVASDAHSNTAAGTGSLIVTTSASGQNAAFGYQALNSNTSGSQNTAIGYWALNLNTIQAGNTAVGFNTLWNVYGNTTSSNTAVGAYSMSSDGGQLNTAMGFAALASNSHDLANFNTAVGAYALNQNSGGVPQGGDGAPFSDNNAVGYEALYSNQGGGGNNAIGATALKLNTIGYYNNAVGYKAMTANTTGYNNNAQGSYALSANTTGFGNSAVGANSMENMVDGCRNVGVGNNTGTGLTNAGLNAAPYDCYDTYIGWGVSGTEGDSGVTVIGNTTYATATYIAGVYGAAAGGIFVCATSSGQLSTGATCAASSSERYKEDIQPLTDTQRLMALDPVSFRYRKADASGNKPIEYGLIAEQVARVYPELVVLDEQGRPDAVKYQDLTPLLLKKVQQQQGELNSQAAQLADAHAKMAAQDAKIASLVSIVRDMQQQFARFNAKSNEPQLAMR